MLLLLHRAIRNAGDFLIFDRAVKLFRAFRPTAKLVVAKAWLPLTDQFRLVELQAFDAVVVCGGPGYQNGLYPQVYPLADLSRLHSPVVLLALGSYSFPGTPSQLRISRFDGPTRAFLDEVQQRAPYLGARDRLTEELLHVNGISEVLMTGDPAWYDLEHMDKVGPTGSNIRSLAFTPPASAVFAGQALRLMRRLAKELPRSRGTVVFHRGLQRRYAAEAGRLGWSIEDISGSLDGFQFYDSVDLHVGYRVHAHLYCLSHALRSYLIAEDSRGIGALQTLGPLGVDPLTRHDRSWRPLQRVRLVAGNLARLPGPVSDRLLEVLAPAVTAEIGDELMAQLALDQSGSWQRLRQARETMRLTLPVMRTMIESIP
ncbi:MAG: polysaccharide pyruvyl transferase family protein [Chloroflexota bacterium]